MPPATEPEENLLAEFSGKFKKKNNYRKKKHQQQNECCSVFRRITKCQKRYGTVSKETCCVFRSLYNGAGCLKVGHISIPGLGLVRVEGLGFN